MADVLNELQIGQLTERKAIVKAARTLVNFVS